MIIEIALATQTAPEQWRNEDDSTLATVVDILNIQANRLRKAGRK